MSKLLLFTDGSVNTKTKVGFGAYLAVYEHENLKSSSSGFAIPKDIDMDFKSIESSTFGFGNLKELKVKRFEQTSSTKLEIQTLLWALHEIKESNNKISVYTDSQNIISLLSRREKLEKNNFCSASGNVLNNSELYQEFYKLIDTINCEFIKVAGHLKSNEKDYIDQLFTLVDRASRKALREYKS